MTDKIVWRPPFPGGARDPSREGESEERLEILRDAESSYGRDPHRRPYRSCASFACCCGLRSVACGHERTTLRVGSGLTSDEAMTAAGPLPYDRSRGRLAQINEIGGEPGGWTSRPSHPQSWE